VRLAALDPAARLAVLAIVDANGVDVRAGKDLEVAHARTSGNRDVALITNFSDTIMSSAAST
jgi:hypothetical protein